VHPSVHCAEDIQYRVDVSGLTPLVDPAASLCKVYSFDKVGVNLHEVVSHESGAPSRLGLTSLSRVVVKDLGEEKFTQQCQQQLVNELAIMLRVKESSLTDVHAPLAAVVVSAAPVDWEDTLWRSVS
jgi:hypothetical protein